MRKEERDSVLRNISQEDRQAYNRIIGEVRSQMTQKKGAARPGSGLRAELTSSGRQLSPGVRAALAAVIARDDQGPDVGEAAPDFFLKKRGTEERVRLSSFRGQRPVALVFGSYT